MINKRISFCNTKHCTFSMDDGELASAARQTLEAVQRRVEMELVAAPLLVSAAMSDSSHLSIKGIFRFESDAAIRIVINLIQTCPIPGVHSSPQLMSSGANGGSARAMWKSMITNASFRTKKLPDDITVAQVAEAAAAAAAAAAATTTSASPSQNQSMTAQLGSITEENDEPSGGGGGKSSFRLSELVKKKSKPKPARNKVNNNGGVIQEGSSHHPHLTDNNGGVNPNSTDWNSDSETKEEAELRRRSNEFNGSTQV